MWLRRMLTVTGASLLLSALLVPAAPVASGAAEDADAAAGLLGYSVTAIATPVSMLYDQPSFGIPATPTFEVRNVYARAELDSGPASYGLSSLVWPGDVVGNAPPAMAFDVVVFDPTAGGHLTPLTDEIRKGAAEGSKDSPPYPVRSESRFPDGGEHASDVAGGARMESKATQTHAEAITTTQRAGFPGVLSIGVMRSRTISFVRNGVATAEARSFVSDLDLFGQLRVESIATVATAVSDGKAARVTGSSVVTGMTIAGRPVVVDETGFHAESVRNDPYGSIAKGWIDAYLKPRGIDLAVTPPIDVVDGASGRRSVGLLQISLSSHGMEQLFSNLPEPYGSWVRSPSSGPLAPLVELFSPDVEGYATTPFAGDQTMTLVFGGAAVSSVAAPGYEIIPPPEVVVDPPIPGGDFVPPVFDPGITPQPQRPRATVGGRKTFPPLRLVGVAGVPGSAVAGALLLALAAATKLRRVAAFAGAPQRGASCPDGGDR